jgi:DNA repair photolyase
MVELSKEEYQSPRITGEILDCSMPMTFDQYNNCGFSCLYCFSTFQRGIGLGSKDYWKKQQIKAINFEKFKKLFSKKYKGQFAYITRNRKPMQWGGLSDPFCPIEEELGVGLKVLNFLSDIKYPISFSSKSDLLLRNKKYWDAFMRNKENYHYKCSIITLNEKIAKVLEAGAPSPKRRLEVLKKLSDAGVETTLRLRPIIIGITNLDCVKLIELAAKAGVKSVSAEFFCLEMRANKLTKEKFKKISQLCGFDIIAYYKKLSKGSGYLRLNYNLKMKYLKPIKEACEKYGLRLHVSDAHHKELSCTGSCCGLPDNHPTLSNYQKSQFTNAIVIARKKGQVKFSDISEDFKWLKSFKWCKASGFNTGGNHNRLKKQDFSMYEYMRNAWNKPNCGHSPYKYFDKALIPSGVDKNGDIIYKYNGAWKK